MLILEACTHYMDSQFIIIKCMKTKVGKNLAANTKYSHQKNYILK